MIRSPADSPAAAHQVVHTAKPACLYRDPCWLRAAVHAGESLAQHRAVARLLYGGAFAEGVTIRSAGDVNVLDAFPTGKMGGGHGRAVITASSAMEYALYGTVNLQCSCTFQQMAIRPRRELVTDPINVAHRGFSAMVAGGFSPGSAAFCPRQ
jgi:hypothetical protein